MSEDSMPSKRMVPEQESAELSDEVARLYQAYANVVRLAAAKDAEIAALKYDIEQALNSLTAEANALDKADEQIAALTEQRDEAIAHADNDRTRAKAYREGRDRATEQRDRAMKALRCILDPAGIGLYGYKRIARDALDALDAEAAAETAPSLPETP